MASKKILKIKPMSELKVTSFYGKRKLSLKSASTNHKGMDFGGTGINLYAAANGTIKTKGYNSARGYYVEVNIGNNYTILYQHMRKSCAYAVNKTIKAGQIIGYKGSTGTATAPHLHFEVRAKGVPVDPLPYFIASYNSVTIKHTLQYRASNTTVQWILEVKKLQEVLKKEKLYVGVVDGSFGPQTKAAVKAYQKKYKLEIDGSFGPKSLAKAKKEHLL